MTPTETGAIDFLKLIARAEGPTIDFKRDGYDLSNSEGCGGLIKDVIAMANTPRTEPAYIILGITAHPDGRKDLIGLTGSVDDAKYQDQLKKVHPCPKFSYIPVQHEGKTYGVIEIPAERRGPCQATMDVGKVRQYQTYWRRGSQNDIARSDEQQEIRDWCSSKVKPPIAIPSSSTTPWDQFLKAAHGFESERIYILICGPCASEPLSRMEGIAAAPWNLVVDFEVGGSLSGGTLAHGVQPELRKNRALHELMLGDRPTVRADNSCYWYYAKGSETRIATMVDDSWNAWKRKYGLDIGQQLASVARERKSRPVTVVSIWDSEDYVDEVFSAALQAFGDGVDFVVAHPASAHLQRLTGRYSARLVEIELAHIAEGIKFLHAASLGASADGVLLPTKSGTRAELDAETLRYLEEELEIVGVTSGTVADEAREMCVTFYRGKQITWFELGLNCDVERDKTGRVLKAVLYDLGGGDDKRSKGTTRINVYHAPGAGGSTIGRNVAWRVHLDFPTVVLRKCLPAETAPRLEKIYQLTALPILVLVEGADVQDSQTEELYSILRARQVSVVFLQVLRRFSPIGEGERSFFQDTPLSVIEATRFAHKLSLARPQRGTRLQKLASTGTVEERSPFYFALETFEADFMGLSTYVSVRLAQATQDQKTLLVFLAISHHYGHQGIPGSACGAFLKLPRAEKVKFDQVFPPLLRDLLRQETGELWRTAHDLVATEILRQLLAPGVSDNRIWRQNLSTWALQFAEFCRGEDPIVSDDMVEIASRCFVFRDDRDPLGSDAPEDGASRGFSQLIQDIPSLEGRLNVLKSVAERFLDQAHFWGHLGRFYALEMGDYESALKAIDKAIEISPQDAVLYHMKGMALRSQLYKAIQPGQTTSIASAVNMANKAAEQFDKARDIDPYDEHGYISHIQMLLRVVEFAKRSSAIPSTQELLTAASTDPTLRDNVDLAEDLLDRASRLRQGERPSIHVEQCKIQLNALYGGFKEVLQGWDNLLTRSDVYRPPIRRQLVRTYVVRRDRRWDQLDGKELSRIVGLLEQNLLEEPNDPRNLRLWLQAVRRMQPPISLDSAIEKVTYWKANTTEIDSVYYLYILHALKAIDGYELALVPFKDSLEECRRRARSRPNRTGSFEWMGPGQALSRLVHFSELGEWSKETDFWKGSGRLSRMKGTIVSIAGPESGFIELGGGVRAFFVPGRSSHSKGRDENRLVECFLGFSYDGPRAWEVRNA